MATEAQMNANRQNAQKSTGPRTEEGKARSSMNNLSHGLRARHVILAYEDREEFEKMCARLEREWQPATLSEEMMLEQIVSAEWNLACFQTAVNEVQMRTPSDDQPACLDRLDLYRRRFESSLMRGHSMLLQLRKARKAEPVTSGSASPVVTPVASYVPDPMPPQVKPDQFTNPAKSSEAVFNPTSKSGKSPILGVPPSKSRPEIPPDIRELLL